MSMMMQAAVRVTIWVLIIAAMVGSLIYTQSTVGQPVTPTCVTDEDRVHIRAQVLAAVDEAFRDNIKHLFTSWIKDPRDQPSRASAGLQNSIVVYQRARADALKWTPNSCEIIK